MKLDFNHEELGQFCESHRIARLELFGSALRDDFRAGSDVDLLATLKNGAHPTLLDWAEMQEKLAELFGRPVDLVSRRAIERSRNRYRKHSILSNATPIYGEG
ncbi:MAG: nucleotidyltransferase family protein [Limisphaerales bacterium]